MPPLALATLLRPPCSGLSCACFLSRRASRCSISSVSSTSTEGLLLPAANHLPSTSNQGNACVFDDPVISKMLSLPFYPPQMKAIPRDNKANIQIRLLFSGRSTPGYPRTLFPILGQNADPRGGGRDSGWVGRQAGTQKCLGRPPQGR